MHKLALTAPLLLGVSLLAEVSDVVTVNWQNITALAAIIIVLLFLVIKYLPDINKQQGEQAKVFAAAAQAQTESTAKSVAQASSEATAAVAKVATEAAKNTADMHREFVATLDKMAQRFDTNMLSMLETMQEMHSSCPAGAAWRDKHGFTALPTGTHG